MPSDAVLAAFSSDEELITREDASKLARRLWSLLDQYHRKIYFAVALIALWTGCLLEHAWLRRNRAGPALIRC